MLNPKGIPWVGLFAADLTALAHFYESVLGLKVIERSEQYWLFDAGAQSLLELWAAGSAKSSRKTPEQQSVLAAFLVEALEPTLAELSEKGLLPDSPIGSYLGTRWAHFTDPEGNRFALKDFRG